MHILSVNIGKSQPISTKSGQTGIFKEPQSSAIEINNLGLANDTIIDTKHHGGVDQAVYIYGQPDYNWWESELGRQLPPGFFGENLTVSKLESAESLIGDRFQIGDVILEVTSPRIPCVTLGARFGDPKFVKRFLNTKRPGLYCRVIKTGLVHTGDEVTMEQFSGKSIRAIEMLDYKKKLSTQEMQDFLETPVHYKTRDACVAGLKAEQPAVAGKRNIF